MDREIPATHTQNRLKIGCMRFFHSDSLSSTSTSKVFTQMLERYVQSMKNKETI